MAPEETLEKKPSRGIYLLPNLFTTGSLFAGFYSVVAAMQGQFSKAALAIFIAMILDSLDGRVARLTNTQTNFGMEYDSLSDAVSFGIAPALVIYSWSLFNLGKLGWLVAFVYTATTVLRLARFNTQAGISSKRYFQGLPCPAAAAVVTSMMWLGHQFSLQGIATAIFAGIITVLVSMLMVSNIRYYSFKEFRFRDKVPFVVIIMIVLGIVCIAINPPALLFLLFLAYAISGPVLTVSSIRSRKSGRKRSPHED